MTTAAEHEQQPSADAGRPPGASALHGLTVLPTGLAPLPLIDDDAAGLCVGGVCRLPGSPR